MKKKIIGIGFILVFAALIILSQAGAAKADTIIFLTQDNCTGDCNPGTGSMGTVTLHQAAAGDVLVTVALVSPLSFVSTGAGIAHTIDFNLSGITTIAVNNISNSAFTLDSTTAGAYHFDGFGDFQYALDVPGTGAGSAQPSPVSFHVVATGLTEASFIGNGDGWYFGADVIKPSTGEGNAVTGPIGGKLSSVPEPSSLLFLGTGLLSLAFWGRRKLGK